MLTIKSSNKPIWDELRITKAEIAEQEKLAKEFALREHVTVNEVLLMYESFFAHIFNSDGLMLPEIDAVTIEEKDFRKMVARYLIRNCDEWKMLFCV